MPFHKKIVYLVLLAGLPSSVGLLAALGVMGFSWAALSLLGIFILGLNIYIAFYLSGRFSFQIRSLTNLLEAIIYGDYSLRGRTSKTKKAQIASIPEDDPLLELVQQINSLADTLVSRRLEAKESQLLLAKIINTIDIALFTVNQNGVLTHANRAFADLFNRKVEGVIGMQAADLRLTDLLQASPNASLEWQFPKRHGRFLIHKDDFIEENKPQSLFILKDVKEILRSEEQEAWKKLIRVIGHEINNSLAPISSLSASLSALVGKEEKEDLLRESLSVIHQRATNMIRLVSGYKEIAKLPSPSFKTMDLVQCINMCVTLYPQIPITISSDAESLWIKGDSAQLEQVFINLIKNAHEAQAAAHPSLPVAEHPSITLTLSEEGDDVFVFIDDQGTGVSNTSNLFVPFYTTKAAGSGIGLAISRQTIESHGGELDLLNRKGIRGCRAKIRLPRQKTINS